MQTGIVDVVIDGNTFTLNTGETVRLAEVDTPEVGSKAYAQVLEKLEQLIGNKVILYDQRGLDDYGRIVADVWVASLYVNDEIHRYVSLL